MKLRNKKTGFITEAYLIIEDSGIRRYADSIKDLCNNYEDYTPKEPLIKDEKIRKTVRAWAKANGIHNCDHLRYDEGCQSLTDIYTRNEISFNYKFDETLDDDKEYTIAELCGEEEE